MPRSDSRVCCPLTELGWPPVSLVQANFTPHDLIQRGDEVFSAVEKVSDSAAN